MLQFGSAKEIYGRTKRDTSCAMPAYALYRIIDGGWNGGRVAETSSQQP